MPARACPGMPASNPKGAATCRHAPLGPAGADGAEGPIGPEGAAEGPMGPKAPSAHRPRRGRGARGAKDGVRVTGTGCEAPHNYLVYKYRPTLFFILYIQYIYILNFKIIYF